MKFLHVRCENRNTDVFVNLDKIVLIEKTEDENICLVRLTNEEPVKAAMSPEDLVRKINGEDRVGIGFRAGR